MVILKQELRQHRGYILGWAIAIALCIFMMTPVYYSLIDVADTSDNSLYSMLGSSDFFSSVGLSTQYLSSQLGIYGFLTAFFALAAGIFGMHFGISIHTKEYTARTSEYLFTKPCSRGQIFWQKAAAVFCGVLIVGTAYLGSSLIAMLLFRSGFDWKEFLLITLSLCLTALIFAGMGLFVGARWSNNRSPLLTAGLVIFIEYCITSFSRVTGIRAFGFLSPFSFFGAAEIAREGFYEWDYLLWYAAVLVVCLTAAYRTFVKKDVLFRA